MAEFEAVLKERKIDVVVIDPFNKAIGKGAETLSNSALTQQYLQGLDDVCARCKVTPIIDNHSGKGSRRKPNGAVNRDETSLSHQLYGGVSSWMRQWAELLRMKPYEDNGEHELLISVGGSNGQASRFALHVQETLASKTSRWNWRLAVKPLDKATSEQQAKKVSEETAALLDKLHTARTWHWAEGGYGTPACTGDPRRQGCDRQTASSA